MSGGNAAPEGWTVATIMDISTSSGGGTPSKADPSYWSRGDLPWVSPKDMKSFFVTSSEDLVTAKALERLTLVPENSILVVVRSGILSRTLPVSINTIPVTINQDMRAFVPSSGIEPRFVAWQLISNERAILDKCSKDGTTVASIEGTALASYPFFVAPAAEQTRIVEKLEELLSDLDAGVAELKAAQKKLAQYRQSLLKAAVEGRLTAAWRAQHGDGGESGVELLARILRERRVRWEAKQLARFEAQGKAPPKGWKDKYPEPVAAETKGLPELPSSWAWASLDQLVSLLRNGLSQKPNMKEIGFPILRINAVRPMAVNLNEVRYLDLADHEARDYLLDDGDILVTRYNGSVDLLGVFGVVRGLTSPTLHPDKLIRIKPVLDKILGDWLEVCGAVGASRNHVVGRVKTTAGQTGISGNDLKKMPIPLAPFSEQGDVIERIGVELREISALSEAVARALRQSAAQRQNILRAAFSGQLNRPGNRGGSLA